MLKVIPRSCNRIPVTLLVRAPALIDRVLQSVIKIFILPAFANLSLIIKLDLIDQQARKPLRLALDLLIRWR